MKGHITKKGNQWYFVLDIGKKPDGKRNRKWFKGGKTKPETEKMCAAKITELSQGTYVEPTKKTVGEYLDEWLEYKRTNKRRPIRQSTYENYKILVDTHVKPAIGRDRLDRLHETNIEDLYEYLQDDKELSPSSVHKIHACILKPAFNRAVRYRYIHHNPADIEDPPQPGKPIIKVWDQEQMHKFLDVAKDDEQYYIFHLCLNTGMRIGETLALKDEFVDTDYGIINIRHTLHSKTCELGPPKTETSLRDIAIDEFTTQVITERKDKIAEDIEKAEGLYKEQGFICCTKTGNPLLQSNVRRKFNSLIEKAGVPKIRIHDMRHTWATLQLLNGTDIHTVSSILGHSSVWFTYDTYVHLLPEKQKEAARTQSNIMQKGANKFIS